eukprot:TRINITY_DN4567_c0_g1_i3.p1 TRINITY_DN4567_c0_g1~~TRINITY_DN4567_c0_g1_i3.p1  ORF type:complete len:316 (+),score=87.93 TRINITY_DN4567_c0_g1_i3:103-1050(+)
MDAGTLLMLAIVAVLACILYYLREQPTSMSVSSSTTGAKSGFLVIPDKYKTIDDVTEALRNAGLESSNLILGPSKFKRSETSLSIALVTELGPPADVGIDFTKSNEHTGRRTFQGRCMHDISPSRLNPYQRVIEVLGKTLEPFDDDKLIPAYGFGDETTRDRQVFPLFASRPCNGFTEVLHRYAEIAPAVRLAGPTSFAPIIYEAINIVREARAYHILVIVADGQVTSERETIAAIVEASKYPLSIVLVGVGDGPWDQMREFDDGLPDRKFDNFQFVNFHEVITKNSDYPEAAFALAALQEIPEQYRTIRKLRLL